MNLKRKLAFILLVSLTACTACSKKTATETNNTAVEPTVETTATIEVTPQQATVTPTVDGTSIEGNGATGQESNLSSEEIERQESLEAYEKFMRNEAKLSFDRFMTDNYMDERFYEMGSEYTLSEILDIVTDRYFEYSTDKKIQYIDYSYLDCGKDGVNELFLRFNGMDLYGEEDDSTLVYIIKYIDGKLDLCYTYETWARSESSINEYGYYQCSGSNGATNHGSEDGLVDKDGNWQPIVSIESELDLNQLARLDGLEQLPIVAESKGITNEIELQSIHLNKDEEVANSEEENSESLYTFYVYDENYELIEDANLYTNSIYKDIFDESKVPFVTPDEIAAMILEKEEEVGATAEIKEGKEITCKTMASNLFSDYVGK
jgi:hypothetical protein